MDRAPLPPHERTWRHPSELGPPPHEPTSTSGRVLIVTTATLSLLLIGLLALSMTPERGAAPLAVEGTTAGATATVAALAQPDASPLPMVTPLGDDGWAVTTEAAVGARSGRMAARLPSGDVVDVEIVRRDPESGVTLVSLPTRTDGYQLAASSPAPSDTVVVHGERPQVVLMVDVARLSVAEASPVLDDDGDLVGLCTWGDGGVAIRTVSTMPATTVTSTTAPRPTTTVLVVATIATSTVPATTTATTVPATTTPPATTAPAPVTSTSVPHPGAIGVATTAPG